MSVSLGGGCCCLLDFQGPIRDSQTFLRCTPSPNTWLTPWLTLWTTPQIKTKTMTFIMNKKWAANCDFRAVSHFCDVSKSSVSEIRCLIKIHVKHRSIGSNVTVRQKKSCCWWKLCLNQEENDLNHKATAMQLPEHVIEAGALLKQDQEERDLELALSLQQQEVEERRAWVVALAGGQQQHRRWLPEPTLKK